MEQQASIRAPGLSAAVIDANASSDPRAVFTVDRAEPRDADALRRDLHCSLNLEEGEPGWSDYQNGDAGRLRNNFLSSSTLVSGHDSCQSQSRL